MSIQAIRTSSGSGAPMIETEVDTAEARFVWMVSVLMTELVCRLSLAPWLQLLTSKVMT